MNIFTHRFLANKIKIALEQKIDFKFKTKDLLWGSIKPDMIKGKVPHIKKENTFNSFFNLINNSKNINPKADPRLFSCKFGQILHFIGDYFCQAHNKKHLTNNTWPHLKYEYQLHKLAKQTDYTLIKIANNNYHNISLPKLITSKHNLFLQLPPSLQKDITISFKTSLLVGQKILAHHFRLKNKNGLQESTCK